MRGLRTYAGIATALGALLASATASAATLEVTKTSDPVPGACTASDCSLREAVRRANQTSAADEIVLKARTYRLEQPNFDDEALVGDLDVIATGGRMEIIGKGRRKTTIDGEGVDRILDVLDGARFSAAQLTLTDGGTSGGGAGLFNKGRTSLRKVVVRGNFAGIVGGGLWNSDDGRLQISRSVIAGNDAGGGGGIWAEDEGSVTISRSRVTGNEALDFGGGGIYNQDESRMRIARSRIDGNDAIESGEKGGGISNQNDARLTIGRSKVIGNRADDDGGGIYNNNDARLTINRSTVSGNRTLDDISGSTYARGGGIFHQNDAVLRISNSTISGNVSPTLGGALFTQNNAVTSLTNTTISGNRADEGGAFYMNNWPKITVAFSTIAKNRASTAGGAIFEATSTPGVSTPQPPYLTLRGALIAGNTAPASDNCLVGAADVWESDGGNVGSDGSCELDAGNDQENADARIRRLARNGGPTKTHALKPSSDAVNAARRRGCPNRDQRGVKRPQGNRCDVGSYELKKN